jgi:misacylated tRNA(Ala) deacylase
MRPLYMEDSYLKEFTATVIEANGTTVVLSDTAFFPAGGGVPCDLGTIEKDGQRFAITNVTKDSGRILHHISGGLAVGDAVRGTIDWPRRHMLMRQHTAAHLLAAIMYNDLGLLITGNQLDLDKSRMDFSMENFDKAVIEGVVEKANAAIQRDPVVKIYFLAREDAMKIPGVVKLAAATPPGSTGLLHFPSVDELRIVEIDGIDIQADGGCHVRSLSEIGSIEFLKAENKGKANRRVYYTVK